MTNRTRYELTDAEREVIANATTEDWIAAAKEIATDGAFWKELGGTVVKAFFEGFTRGLNR